MITVTLRSYIHQHHQMPCEWSGTGKHCHDWKIDVSISAYNSGFKDGNGLPVDFGYVFVRLMEYDYRDAGQVFSGSDEEFASCVYADISALIASRATTQSGNFVSKVVLFDDNNDIKIEYVPDDLPRRIS